MKRQHSCWTIATDPRSTSVIRKLSRLWSSVEKASRSLSGGLESFLNKECITVDIGQRYSPCCWLIRVTMSMSKQTSKQRCQLFRLSLSITLNYSKHHQWDYHPTRDHLQLTLCRVVSCARLMCIKIIRKMLSRTVLLSWSQGTWYMNHKHVVLK